MKEIYWDTEKKIGYYYFSNKSEMGLLAHLIAAIAQPGFFLFLEGPLGVGKTTLAKIIGVHLGVLVNSMSSPTFIINYQIPTGRKNLFISHTDCYRLSEKEGREIVMHSYDYSYNSLSIIEWGNNINWKTSELTNWIRIRLEFIDSCSARKVKIEGGGDFLWRLRKKLANYLKKNW